MNRIRVASTEELAPGSALQVDVDGQLVALFNIGGRYFAIGAVCTHEGGPLADGDVEGTHVICPWHGATFDLRTGEVLAPPAQRSVPSFGVIIEGRDVFIEIA